MSRLMVFQHVAAEPLGTLHARIRARGHRIRFHNFQRDPQAKPNVDRYQALIVLGGPMHVEDQHRHPHLKTELQAIEATLRQGKPVLGICLGAQLLAHVLGAPVRRHCEYEIGWYDLAPTPAARGASVLGHLGPRTPVFQWHACTFGLPAGAVQLARTATCEQQAFRFGSNAYGFQFHMEADDPMIERWLRLPSYREELAAAGIGRDAASILAGNAAAMRTMRPVAEAAFNSFLDLVGPPIRRLVFSSRHGME
jgi:GMP synthase (glutamine-hydrolysing)